MNKQNIIHANPDGVRLAALLSFMGYTFRFDSAAQSFLFRDPGDIDEGIQSYENGLQVATAKMLLEVHDEFLTQLSKKSPVPMGDGIELLPTKIETQQGREWTTKDFNTANLLFYRGNELLNARVENGRTAFTFAYDGGLTDVVALFNQNKLRVSPAAWSEAGFKVRNAMRAAKGAA